MPKAARTAARTARRLAILLTPTLTSIINAAPAWAATGVTAASLWIGITDSSQVPLGIYGLSLNNGSLTDPTAAPPALSMHWFYSVFLGIITTPIWLVNNVLSFKWLQIISGPLDFVGRQLTAMVHAPAVLTAVGLIAASIIAVNFALGKVSRAAAQITVAVLMATMSVAVAHKPISELLGPNGALTVGRNIGVELTGELSGKSMQGQNAVDQMTQSLADHFVRTPTLIWNYGQDLDSAPYNCGQAFTNSITTEPIDKVKDAVWHNCPNGKALHDYAMSDPTDRKIVAWFSIIFALVVLFVFGYLCIQVVILGLSSVFWAIVAVVALVTGWIPGAPQNLALKAGLDALFSFAGMTMMVTILGITGNLAGAMFSSSGGDLVVAMPMVALVLAAVFLALRRVRKGLVTARERMVQAAQRFTGNEHSHLSATTNTLDYLDPLTAIPNATRRIKDATHRAGSTATKAAVATFAPEAAPFLGATEHLQSRLSIRNLRSSRHTTTTNTDQQPTSRFGTPTQAYDTAPTATDVTSSGRELTSESADLAPEQPPRHDASDHQLNPITTPSTSSSLRRDGAAAAAVSALTTPNQPTATNLGMSDTTSVERSDAYAFQRTRAPASGPMPVPEFRQQYPHLCGQPTARGQNCVNAASSCPHHRDATRGTAAAAIHPAIAALAQPPQDGSDMTATPSADIRSDMLARGRQ